MHAAEAVNQQCSTALSSLYSALTALSAALDTAPPGGGSGRGGAHLHSRFIQERPACGAQLRERRPAGAATSRQPVSRAESSIHHRHLVMRLPALLKLLLAVRPWK